MTDKTSNRCVIWVGVGTSETESSVPSIGCGLITRAQSQDLGLSSNSGILSSLVGTADVGELILDSVGDDVWVQGLLLSFVHDRVDSLEGGLGVPASVQSKFELDGWDTGTEVETGDAGSDKSIKVTSDSICYSTDTSSSCGSSGSS